jgi:hypothetical protein
LVSRDHAHAQARRQSQARGGGLRAAMRDPGSELATRDHSQARDYDSQARDYDSQARGYYS